MDELIARITAALGVEAGVASLAIGHVLVFLQRGFPDGPVAELLEKLPGANEAIEAAAAAAPAGDGGPMAGFGGVMALAGTLGGVGLGFNQIQKLAKEFFAYAKELIGEEKVQEIARAIPGLPQFL